MCITTYVPLNVGNVRKAPFSIRSCISRLIKGSYYCFNCRPCHLFIYLNCRATHGSLVGQPMHCEYHNCKTPVKNTKELMRHVEEFHAYQCPECPRHLQTTSGLSKHYKKAHISNELLCCNYCGNCYKDERELAHHVKEKHLLDNNSGTATESSDAEQLNNRYVLSGI